MEYSRIQRIRVHACRAMGSRALLLNQVIRRPFTNYGFGGEGEGGEKLGGGIEKFQQRGVAPNFYGPDKGGGGDDLEKNINCFLNL